LHILEIVQPFLHLSNIEIFFLFTPKTQKISKFK
jgi:hypothetical protein